MLSDPLKYWLAVGAIMLLMFGYTGKIGSVLIFGIAAGGAFVYWQVMARRRKSAGERHSEGRPRGA
jgi:hypothetical protein